MGAVDFHEALIRLKNSTHDIDKHKKALDKIFEVADYKKEIACKSASKSARLSKSKQRGDK